MDVGDIMYTFGDRVLAKRRRGQAGLRDVVEMKCFHAAVRIFLSSSGNHCIVSGV